MQPASTVLLVTTKEDGDLVRSTLGDAFAYSAPGPNPDNWPSSSTDLAFVVTSHLSDSRNAVSRLAQRFPVIALLDSSEAPVALELLDQRYLVVTRGPGLQVQLAQAAAHARERSATRNFLTTLDGPLRHDFRGLIGNLQLAATLLPLKSDDATRELARDKILQHCIRLSSWMNDLDAQGIVSFEPLPHRDESVRTEWGAILGTKVKELGLTFPRRSLVFKGSSQSRSALAPFDVLVILEGLVALAVRTTLSREAISVALGSPDEQGFSITVTTENSEAPPHWGDRLRVLPHLWSPPPDAEIPFRFVTATRLARSSGGEISATWSNGSLSVRAFWPELSLLAA